MTKEQKLQAEIQRTKNMQKYENEYAAYANICGVDEAGRGPLCGPVVAGAVILPKNCDILYINDSKKLSEKMRDTLYEEISKRAIAWGVGIVSPERIDEINILQATYEAMRIAIGNLSVTPDILLNDAVTIPDIDIMQVPIIKGDAKSQTIAAASIMAKVTRDRIMAQYDELYPEYGFAKHKGYGTKAHIEAIKEYGPCPIHRRTFIKKIVKQ
ncbi:MAG: ribonuclease HII [Butyrivibrio sp.]